MQQPNNNTKLEDPDYIDPLDQAFLMSESEDGNSIDLDTNDTGTTKIGSENTGTQAPDADETKSDETGNIPDPDIHMNGSNNNQDTTNNDDNKTPEAKDKKPNLSFDPDKVLCKEYIKHEAKLSSNILPVIPEFQRYYEVFNTIVGKHKEIFKQDNEFDAVQWFDTYMQVIQPPFVTMPKLTDLDEDTAVSYFTSLRLDRIEHVYSLYLILLFIRRLKPKLFETMIGIDNIIRFLSFAFRPQIVFIKDIENYELDEYRKIKMREYLYYTYEEALNLIESVVLAQVNIMNELCTEDCNDMIVVHRTLQCYYDYAKCVLSRAYLIITYIVKILHSSGQRTAFTYTSKQLKFKYEDYVTVNPDLVPKQYLKTKTTQDRLTGSKRKRTGNVSDFASENPVKKRVSLADVFSHSTHSKNGKTADPTHASKSGSNARINPKSKTEPPIATEQKDNYDYVTKEFEKKHIKDLLDQFQFKYDAKGYEAAIKLIHKIKDFQETLDMSYKGKYQESMIITKVERGMKDYVMRRWTNHCQSLRTQGVTPPIKTITRLIEWIVKDKDLRNAYQVSYEHIQQFKPKTRRLLDMIVEFKLLIERHKYTKQYASKQMQEKFTLSIPDQILILFNKFNEDAQSFLKSMKRTENFAQIRAIEIQRKQLGQPVLTKDELQVLQNNTAWDSWDEFGQHCTMYVNDRVTQNDYNVFAQTQVKTSTSTNGKRRVPWKDRRRPRSRSTRKPNKPTTTPKATTANPNGRQVTVADSSKNGNKGRYVDPIETAVGPNGMNGRYLIVEEGVKYIKSQPPSVAYRPMVCRRFVKKNKRCNLPGHSAFLHDCVMKIPGLSGKLARMYANQFPDKARELADQRYGQGNDPPRSRTVPKSGTPNGKPHGKGKRTRPRRRPNGKPTPSIHLLQQKINIQPDGTKISATATPTSDINQIGVLTQSPPSESPPALA